MSITLIVILNAVLGTAIVAGLAHLMVRIAQISTPRPARRATAARSGRGLRRQARPRVRGGQLAR